MDVFCRQHPASEQPDIVAIRRGSIGVNRDLGFRAPVVLDADHAAQTFRVSGTLAAVLKGPLPRGSPVAPPRSARTSIAATYQR